MKPVAALLFLALGLSTQMAEAISVTTKEELQMLPPICASTRTMSEISGDTRPIEEYMRTYGGAFSHLHHYCWALNTENKFRKSPNKYRGYLPGAIGDLDYILNLNKDPNFVFLPDIHLAKARIFLYQKQRGKAIASALEAIQTKQDFVPAYTYLSDLYEDMGNKSEAIKTLKNGLKHAPESTPILRRLARLGVKPPKPEAAPQQVSKDPANLPTPAATDTSSQSSPIAPAQQPVDVQQSQTTENTPIAAPPIQPEQQPKTETTQDPKNPYCRFCP